MSVLGFPGDSVVKNLPANAGDAGNAGLIPELGRSPGVGNGNPLQYSCLENSMDRGAWQATVPGITKSQTWLSNWAHTPFFYIEKYGHSIKLIHLFVQQFIQCLESDGHKLFQVGWTKPEAVTSSWSSQHCSLAYTHIYIDLIIYWHGHRVKDRHLRSTDRWTSPHACTPETTTHIQNTSGSPESSFPTHRAFFTETHSGVYGFFMGVGFIPRTRPNLSFSVEPLLGWAPLALWDRQASGHHWRLGVHLPKTSGHLPSLGTLETEAQVSCAPRSKVRTAFLLLTAALPVLSGLGRPQQRRQGKRAQSQEVVGGKERIKGLIHFAWVKGQGAWVQGNG